MLVVLVASDGLIDIDLFGGVVPYFISVNSVLQILTYLDSLSAGAYFYNVSRFK